MTDASVSCPKCASPVPHGAFLCANCGHTIGGSDTDAPARPARSSATERTLALRANIPAQPAKGKQKRDKAPVDEAAERARREAEAAKLEVEKAKKEAERIAAERARAEKAAAKEAARVAAEQAKAAKKSERAARDLAARGATAREAASREQRRTEAPADTPTEDVRSGAEAPEAGTTAIDSATETARRRATATDRVNALRAPSGASAPAGAAKPPKPARAPKPTKAPKAAKAPRAPKPPKASTSGRPAGASPASRLFGAAAVIAIFAIAGAGVAVLRGSDSGADGPGSGFGSEPTDVAMPDLPLESSRYADLIEGSGEPADAGDTLTVNYVYYQSSTGEQIDSSFGRDEPWTFVLGVGEVIPGLDKGLVGVKAGGRRQIDIVPELAYGDTGIEGLLGPGEALTFVIDVISVVAGPPPTDPTTTTTSTTLPPDPNETAIAGLAVEIEQGRATAATLTGTWVLQLAVEYVGLEQDGVVLDAQTIFATFQERLAEYPVLMLDAADWNWDTAFDTPDGTDTLYITVVGLPFNTRTEARAWAENNGIARDDYELIAFPEPIA